MTLNEFFPPLLKNNLEMLKMTVADLSDADLLVRPVTGANHANWQIGHLLKAEHSLMSGCKLVMPELPAGFADRYIKQAAALDDASSFATKAELLELFTKVRAASAEHAAKLPADRWTEKGKVKGGQPLKAEGKIVSGKHGRVVADGPFAESKETIGGYFLLDVGTMDEALAIARECPGLPYGAVVEVRPIAERCTLADEAGVEYPMATATA